MMLVALMSVTRAWADVYEIKYKASRQLDDVDGKFQYFNYSDINVAIDDHTYNKRTQEGTIYISDSRPIQIAQQAFQGNQDLISITLPSGITRIEDRTFEFCRNLESISLPSNLESIGKFAFAGSGLKNITIPESLTTLGIDVFSDCYSLESVEIRANLNTLPSFTFQSCTKLTNVILPQGLERIGRYSFERCSGLTSLDFLPSGLKYIEEGVFLDCSGLISCSLPIGVTEISNICFKGCTSLASLSLPDGVTSIGASAFEGCSSLTSLNIPDGVTSIQGSTFKGCTKLFSISIPASITSIGASAFEGCSSLTSLNIPSGVKTIQGSTFKGCANLSSISFPADITSIGNSAFEGCAKLASFTVPTTVTTISQASFKGCSSFAQFTFHSGITSIGASAFDGCTGLAEIWVEPTTPPTAGSNAFKSVNKSIPVHVPAKTKAVYQAATGWSEFTNFITPRVTLDLDDETAFTAETNVLYDELTYTRSFPTAGKWQSLFVPFDIVITEELLDKCDIAKPYMVATEGSTDGNIHEDDCGDVVVLKKLKEGDTAKHGTAYFIRPKEVGEFRLILDNALVYACTDVTTLTCSTTEDDYAFIGQYTEGKPASGTTWYALAGGNFQLGDEGSPNLYAQRWYMTKTSKSGEPAYAPARAIRLTTWGEEEAADGVTGVTHVITDETEGENAIYSISGVRLNHLQKGLNIVNGRKVFIK